MYFVLKWFPLVLNRIGACDYFEVEQQYFNWNGFLWVLNGIGAHVYFVLGMPLLSLFFLCLFLKKAQMH
jgi:hypothetical protein